MIHLNNEVVFVYRNLRTKNFSCLSVKKRRVSFRTTHGMIIDPIFKVSENGRQRVLRMKQKNVHAGIQGRFMGISEVAALNINTIKPWVQVTYNPYMMSSFIRCDTQEPISKATYAILRPDGKVWALNPS